MASSEEDKVPPTPSNLESVTEKAEVEPVDDRTSDKLSDEGLGTSETDKNEEEKLNEVLDASNEDLAPGAMETSNNFTSQDSSSAKPEGAHTEDVSVEPAVSETKETVEEPQTEGKEMERGQKETEENKMEVETTQIIEEKQPEQVKEKGVMVSVESQSEPEEAPVQTASISQEVTQAEEVCEESQEKMPTQELTEARTEDGVTAKNGNAENLVSNETDTIINGVADTKSSVEESSAEAELENKTTESQSEKSKSETSEEAEQPAQENQAGKEHGRQEHAQNESGIVTDEVKDVSKVSDQTSKDDGETSARADEVASQVDTSVQGGEADSEAKMEPGSPAVVKSDVEKDSDSGSSSLDLNLSISSFLSKSKEGGSISMQVKPSASHSLLLYVFNPALIISPSETSLVFWQESKRQKKTLKKTRKFMVDGVEVSVTTSKIVTDNDAKSEEMRFLRYSCVQSAA